MPLMHACTHEPFQTSPKQPAPSLDISLTASLLTSRSRNCTTGRMRGQAFTSFVHSPSAFTVTKEEAFTRMGNFFSHH